MRPKKKGAIGLNDVIPIAISLVVLGLVLGIGADILSSMNATQCPSGTVYNQTSNECVNGSNHPQTASYTYEFNATRNGMVGLDELAGFQGTIGIVVALAVIIGILGFLYIR